MVTVSVKVGILRNSNYDKKVVSCPTKISSRTKKYNIAMC